MSLLVFKKNFLGIKISSITVRQAVIESKKGCLIVAPSGPGLAEIDKDVFYFKAVSAADINLPDSGLAIALCRLLGFGTIIRTSGLGFLVALLKDGDFKNSKSSFWVIPSEQSLIKNRKWLFKEGINLSASSFYVAPIYPRKGKVEDKALLNILNTKRPDFIFICVGSGPQEKLGYWLKIHLQYKPTIVCIGAAIGFLSGDQVRIPLWVDRFCLGWLIRCLSNPTRFIPRYFKAFRLIYLAFRYRDQAPPIKPF